jgi:hypothetical protein
VRAPRAACAEPSAAGRGRGDARFASPRPQSGICPRCEWPLPIAAAAPPPPSFRGFAAPPTCSECGCLLDERERRLGKICRHYRCQSRAHSRARQVFQDEYEARAAALRTASVGLEGIATLDDVPTAVGFLPGCERKLVPIPEERRAAFRAHLERVAAEGLEEGHPTPAEPDFLADPLLAQACALCEGQCCGNGGDRAYLDGRTLARFFAERADGGGGTVEEAVALYLGYLAEESYEGGCIYQGARGCTLPRSLRAEVCNSHLCNGMRTLAAAIGREGTRAIILSTVSLTSGATRAPDGKLRLAIIDERAGTTRLALPEGWTPERAIDAAEPAPATATAIATEPAWMDDLRRVARDCGVPFDPDR